MLRYRLSEQQVMYLFGKATLYQQLSQSERTLCQEFLYTDFRWEA
jgi:hypothetical protein